MDYFIIERRKGMCETADGNCFLSSSIDNVINWINNNLDFAERDYNWWWVVIKIKPDDEWGGEIYKVFDWDGNELNEQPIKIKK